MHDKLGKSKVLCIYAGCFKYSRVYMLVHLVEVAYTNLFRKLNYWSDNTDSPPLSVLFPTLSSRSLTQGPIRVITQFLTINPILVDYLAYQYVSSYI